MRSKVKDFAFQKGDPTSIKYLALEGGGGKGNAYLGAIQVLELLGKLPLSKIEFDLINGSKENPPSYDPFKGISGASAGAITSFLLSLGCSSVQINSEMTENDFNDFYEKPLPCIYKCVKDEGEGNKFYITTDGYRFVKPQEELRDKYDPLTGNQYVLQKKTIEITHGHNSFSNLEEAQLSAKKNLKFYKNYFYNHNIVFSFIAKSVINHFIQAFLLGSIRALINSEIIKKLLEGLNGSKLKQAVNKIGDTLGKINKLFKDAYNFIGKELLIPGLFNKFIRNPIWKYLYSPIVLSKKKRTRLFSQDMFQRLGNDYYGEYFDSIKFDRGLWTGINVRKFFSDCTLRYLIQNYKVFIADVDGTNINEIYENYKDFFTEKNFKEALEFNEQNENTIHILTLDELIHIDFKSLYDITGVDLRVATSNISIFKPCYFSYLHTPLFPVIDAVCMSMSIPVAFKPTFVDESVILNPNLDNDIDNSFLTNADYHGFHADGGLLNNLPLHLFDNKSSVNNPLENENSNLNPEILGIRCSDGFPFEKYPKTPEEAGYSDFGQYLTEDEAKKVSDSDISKLYLTDPLYLQYVNKRFEGYRSKRKRSNKKGNRSKINTYSVDTKTKYFNGAYGILGDYVNNMVETAIYYQEEEGQFRTNNERKQTLELFCYFVGIFDFGPNNDKKQKIMPVEIFKFIQVRALIKTAAWLNIELIQIESILKNYYKDNINVDDESIWYNLKKEQLDKFYQSCIG